MKKHKKIIISSVIAAVVVAALLTSIILTAGGGIDVIKRYSIESFDEIVNTAEGYISFDNDTWTLESPKGGAEFFWSEGNDGGYNVGYNLDVTPFLNAGLDTSKLPNDYTVNGNTLSLGARYGEKAFSYSGEKTASSVMENIINLYRNKLGYHSSMGHFNLDLGNGNTFEWAQDISSNAKDVVFALNPEPFISAGVDPEKVDGWLYDEVEMHSEGKTVKMYLFLKPSDLA